MDEAYPIYGFAGGLDMFSLVNEARFHSFKAFSLFASGICQTHGKEGPCFLFEKGRVFLFLSVL